MSQITLIDPVVFVACPASPSTFDEGYYLTDSDDDSDSKQSHPATTTTQQGTWKTSFNNALTKTRNWMAHVLSWQSVKAFFEKALTKTGNFLARVFCQNNVMNAVAYHEKKAHDIGIASRLASHNICNQATALRDVTIPTTDTAMQSSGENRSWAAKKAKAALFGAAAVVRVLWATGKMTFDVAISAVEVAGAGALYAIDKL